METLNRLRSDRPRRKNDFYETPPDLCSAAMGRLLRDERIHDLIVFGMDAGAGNGVWGVEFAKRFPSHLSYGIDINPIPGDIYYLAATADFLSFELPILNRWDLVYGNPPYSLAEEFVRRDMSLVRDGGYVYFLLRLSFLASKKRCFGLFKDYPIKRVYVLSKRPSFFTTREGGKTTDALDYAMFLWEKGWSGKTELDWLYWEYKK